MTEGWRAVIKMSLSLGIPVGGLIIYFGDWRVLIIPAGLLCIGAWVWGVDKAVDRIWRR